MKTYIKTLLYKILSLLDYINYHFIYKEKLIDNYKTIEEIEIKDNSISILSDNGFNQLSSLMISKPFKIWHIELENGYKLECADEHIVFLEDFKEIYVNQLNINDKIITDTGLSKVINIYITSEKISMCDTTVDHVNHRFYSNGILSHNSVTTAIYCLWVILFNTDKTGLILSKSGAAGHDLLNKIKDMYLYLPYHIKCGTMKWNQSGISFDNNSNISTEAFSPTAGLGKTINFLILDEFAWCPANEVELFYNNIIPTVTTMSDSNVCIMSTQNGFNLFYKIWKSAVEKKSIYAPFKIDWHQVPQWNSKTKEWEKRTEKWKQEMIGVLGSEEAFYYQYGTQFLAPEGCLVSRECLKRIHETTVLFDKITEKQCEEIALQIQFKDALYIKPGYDIRNFIDCQHWYVITVDLAEGGGGDYTVFNIFEYVDKDKFEQVAYWYSNEVDIELAALDFWLLCGQLFNNDRCLWSVEWNTYGALFYNLLKNYNEPDFSPETEWRNNIVPDGIDLFYFARYKRQSIDDDGQGSKLIQGIRFSNANKALACSLLRLMFEKGDVVITDLVTAGELENFEDKNGNGSYKAAFGHDDIIMTCCQLPLLKQTARYKDYAEDYLAFKIEGKFNNLSDNDYVSSIYNFNTSREEELFAIPEGMRQI